MRGARALRWRWAADEIAGGGDRLMASRLRIAPLGDRAWLLRGLRRAERIALACADRPPEVVEVVCGPVDVVVVMRDPLVPQAILLRLLDEVLSGVSAPARVPVAHLFSIRYGGADTDLEELAVALRLPATEIVQRHASARYTVVATGFRPGFAYLGGLARTLRTPRKTTPALRVAAGAVGIGHAYTGIYPQSGPGGWWIVGHVDELEVASLWQPQEDPPIRLQVGDRVRFRPIADP